MSHKDFLKKYNNPEEYDETFIGSSEDELSFYTDYVKKFKKILYLGSGTGRLLREFLPLNKNILAVEFSKKMANYSKKVLLNANIICQDVLELDLREQFDLVLAPYRFLTHFDFSELEKLFQVVSDHLKIGGYFVGDIFSPYLPHDRTIKCEIESTEVVGDVIEKIYSCYDHPNQICVEIIEKINTKNNQRSIIEMPWHYYYPEQLKNLADNNNLKVINFYSTFRKTSLNYDDEDLIFIMRKENQKH